MWTGRFQYMMLDILSPKLTFSCIGAPFLSVKENKEGGFEVTADILVPYYEDAIFYFLQDHPERAQNPTYQNAPASDKVKTAYTYLWNNFQSEVSETKTESQLQELLLSFKGFERDVERYQSIIKWIISEQEQALKEPNSVHGREFVKYMDKMDHIMTLLVCLGQVCKIIPQGIKLIAGRLEKLKLPATESSNFNMSEGFGSYLNEQHRAKLMPYLVSTYTNQKPEQYGFLLYALIDSNNASKSILTSPTAVHVALQISFGKVGTRQALNTAINRLDPVQSNDEDKRQITIHKNRITEFLKTVGTD